jgi:hypothetical protein
VVFAVGALCAVGGLIMAGTIAYGALGWRAAMPEARTSRFVGTVYVKANLFEVENTDADIPISGGIRKPTE